ncbi:hypothetical protein EDF46_0424 [Frondihabitans sp. PhB188]|uniref:hypothetical protein n=1 Tax=Frondihabitans sp. PhB188 TaxID=2485200 RepID=UPI000F47DDE5|nr:hypothetical protein [Frondihabitans sp. PhB188]ROQ41057.1 hypothetical protein EDF46_0424 [Frondihabitans sp. PhB188]
MTTTLPHLLSPADLPAAELQALALDGDVYRIDELFCSVAEFDVPWRRAAAVHERGVLESGAVLARLSAAWVWGAVDGAPALDEMARGSRDRLDELDRVDFGSVAVTAPARTVVDLLREGGSRSGTLRAAGRLARLHRVDRAACEAALARCAHLPNARVAASRLAAVL